MRQAAELIGAIVLGPPIAAVFVVFWLMAIIVRLFVEIILACLERASRKEVRN